MIKRGIFGYGDGMDGEWIVLIILGKKVNRNKEREDWWWICRKNHQKGVDDGIFVT